MLGQALELEYGADLTIGPALEEGFYYDWCGCWCNGLATCGPVCTCFVVCVRASNDCHSLCTACLNSQPPLLLFPHCSYLGDRTLNEGEKARITKRMQQVGASKTCENAAPWRHRPVFAPWDCRCRGGMCPSDMVHFALLTPLPFTHAALRRR